MSFIDSRPALFVPFYYDTDYSQIPQDLASLATEAKATNENIDPCRIWYFDTLPKNLNVSSAHFPASVAALDLEYRIKSTPSQKNRLILLVSPAYDYPEARLDIYFVKNSDNQITFDAYGIPIREATEITENRLHYFSRMSDQPDLPNLTNLDLLMTPAYSTYETFDDMIAMAQLAIPLPDPVWKAILSGEIKHRCLHLTQQLVPLALSMQHQINQGIDPYKIGFEAENQLISKSGILDFAGSGCGTSNSNFLFTSPSPEGQCKIRCPKCGWEPNLQQLEEIKSGRLKSCPGKNGAYCGYTPRK